MTCFRWPALFIIVCALSLGGCASHGHEEEETVVVPAPMPVSAEMRQRLAARAPDAVIGLVVAVLSDERLAAVGDVAVTQFNRDDVITFVGSDSLTGVNGVVLGIVDNTVHVRFDVPDADQRAPIVGDLAVRFPKR